MKNSKEPIVSKYLKRQITRRQVVKLGGVAALGLVFHKPLISSLTPTPVFANYEPPNGNGEGCTPGFWKNHTSEPPWEISTGTTLGQSPEGTDGPFDFSSANADVKSLASETFLQALSFMGGSTLKEKAQIMLRAAAAAYLNALHFPGTFPLTPAQVISQVNAVLPSTNGQDFVDLGTTLDNQNNDGDCIFFRA